MSRSSLRDAAAIASTLCHIAKDIVLSPGGARPAAARGPLRPWPTQTVAKQDAPDADGSTSGSSQNPIATSSKLAEAVEPTSERRPAARPWPTRTQAAKPTAAPDAQKRSATPQELSPELRQPTVASAAPPAPRASRSPAARQSAPSEPTREATTPSLHVPPADHVTSSSTAPEAVLTRAEPMRRSSPAPAKSPLPATQSASASKIEATPTASPTPTPLAASAPFQPVEPAFEGEEYDAVEEAKHAPLRAAKVPSSRIGRLFHYGGLGAGLAFGAAGSLLRGASSSGADGGASSSVFMSEQNVARLVDKLSTMRGAALKLGQFLSIQETKLLPPQIEQVLLRVQNSANYMPIWQMNKVMSQQLGGADWRERHFKHFDDIPFASASIGQVHSAVLRDDFADPEMAGKKVAVKIQFPGVLESIDSDLSYLRWLVSASALLPKGLFLENTLRVLGRELKDECDYEREAEMGRRFRSILHDSSEFEVPKVVDALSTSKVLTTEMMRGRPLSMASRYPQATRDQIAQSILNLSLSELFRFRLMQTDPNWSNFLYNERTRKIQLIDFGATREYSKAFMDNWLQMLQAAIAGDYDECLIWSRRVGYLTGDESAGMERAHVESMIALGEPFRPDAPDPYPFEHQTITDRVKAQIPLMLRERLTPPPQETYSLNRKLSGAFLLCARLKAHVSCRELFERVQADYAFGPETAQGEAATSDATPSSAATSSVFGSAEQRRQFHTAFRRAEEAQSLSSPRRKHGRNLLDRFPRSKIILLDEAVTASQGSSEIGDKVESLAAAPTASPSMQETPANAVESESAAGIDVERTATPAEVTPSPAPAPEANVSLGPTTIRGIVIPLKPPPPGPEECCMSGCAHCAYDIYAEDLEDFHSRLSAVRTQLTQLSPSVTRVEWRTDLLGDYPSALASGGSVSTAADGAVSEQELRERAQREVDRVIGDLDPTMRAFLEMERKLKKQEREKSQQAQTA